MDTAALFAVFSETTSQPQSTVAAAGTHNVGHEHDKEEAKRQIQERNRLESSWYRGWMARRGNYPRFFRGRIIVQDEKDEGGAYALAFQAAQAAGSHVNTARDTQVVIFSDASMDPRKQTGTCAGAGVALRRHDPSLASAPNGMVEVWAGWPVWADEADALNITGAETLALSFAIHVAMVELYRLEARLAVEEKKRREQKEERKASEREERQVRKMAKRHRKLAKKERIKERDAKRTKERLREKRAERKERRMARREHKRLKRATKSNQRRTKVTVKIFTDSTGALLMLDGQLPMTTAGLRMAATAAIEQSMELERRFVNRAASSALMDVGLELHWVPGHSGRKREQHRRADGEARRLHKKADAEAGTARDWACWNINNWSRGCGYPVSRKEFDAYVADLNGELPECDEPAVSLPLLPLSEQVGELPQ
ncbi:hypothetical protein GE21DRAFT_9589 [Neurospora crassa]|uniref:Uncharacterized protein n=1 Tax=Neurospora crassa (strain ATCC 24698 / 74-OR23-1A / CBS 708.71 / DSM 1257 / FGSC 987) TaxID=367110 RepID=Q7RX05_NEUCR|nr:hypothetical protein NCU05019 [Neurospora crassa OR74A]EAA27052.1 hypothetical protein NCU05019 [Neurospora crassa OR74A]KHE80403.1 hypothetical protein GE21DRAFT_9589 [Neurospora crassa]|eukprot:XP_956288.1 hypothetical protein NCU05019 [Neurospora crassa OR74A]